MGQAVKIYVTIIKTIPSEYNEMKDSLEGCRATVWVKAVSAESAQLKALRYVSEHQWLPVSIEQNAIETIYEPSARQQKFAEVDLAHRFGISAVFEAWERKERGMS